MACVTWRTASAMARANWSLRSPEGAVGTGVPGDFRRWGSMMKYAADVISAHYVISGLSRVLAEGNDQRQNFWQPPLLEVGGQFIQRGSRSEERRVGKECRS